MLNHLLARSGENPAGAGGGSTFLPGFEIREGKLTEKIIRAEAGMSMKTKLTSGKMPDEKSEKVGHLGVIERFYGDICAYLKEKHMTFSRFTWNLGPAAQPARALGLGTLGERAHGRARNAAFRPAQEPPEPRERGNKFSSQRSEPQPRITASDE